MPEFGTVLGIWAHPDDETYLTAGLMMRAAAAGGRVACITATRGEAGSSDESRWPPGERLAAVRTAESDEAFSILGIGEHHWLDYPDGGCAQIPDDVAVRALLEIARDIEPDLVVTFPPSGLTGHPDHRTVSRWTDLLVRQLGSRPRLFHAVHEQDWLNEHEERLAELGVFMVGRPDSVAAADAIMLLLTAEERERKWQALCAQESQTQAFFDALGHDRARQMIAQESFIDVPTPGSQ